MRFENGWSSCSILPIFLFSSSMNSPVLSFEHKLKAVPHSQKIINKNKNSYATVSAFVQFFETELSCWGKRHWWVNGLAHIPRLYCFSTTWNTWFGLSFEKWLKALRPGWCGSVDWVPACEPKGHRLDYQSGHMPGFGGQVPSREHTRSNHILMFLSLPLSKNKQIKSI